MTTGARRVGGGAAAGAHAGGGPAPSVRALSRLVVLLDRPLVRTAAGLADPTDLEHVRDLLLAELYRCHRDRAAPGRAQDERDDAVAGRVEEAGGAGTEWPYPRRCEWCGAWVRHPSCEATRYCSARCRTNASAARWRADRALRRYWREVAP